MADDKKHKESPRKLSHLQVSRKLSRGGDDSLDVDEYAKEYYNSQDRRSSSQSISRFNSCPQLDQEAETHSESYEHTTDDINTGYTGRYTEHQCVIVQGPSPLLQRKVYLENGEMSDTPTPPSTPKSRRSAFSSRESLLSSPDKTYVPSPFTSPRLLLRKQLIQSALSRDSSVESLTEKSAGDTAKKVPLSVENLNRFDEIKSKDESVKIPKEESEKSHKPRGRRSIQPEISDTVNKCENWLQSLQIVQTDRIKSRSNIQLPPI